MNIETIDRDDRQVQVIAEFDADTFERFKRQAARKISAETRIAGFRPGKAPYDMVRRMYGDKAIQDEALNLMLDEVYPQVIQEAKVEPYGPGKLDEILALEPPKFSFIIPLAPVVDLGEYKEIRMEYVEPAISDEKVDQFIERLRRRSGTAIPVERKAEVGDLVAIKLSAKLLTPDEGKNATLIEEGQYELVAGSPEDHTDEDGNEWPFPGFVNELVGLGAGDAKTIRHTFSDEGNTDDLSGKEAEFAVAVENVKELQKPDLNDEFAATLGPYETLEALKKDVFNRLDRTEKEQYRNDYVEDLVEKLVDGATVTYPPALVDDEVEHTLHHFQEDLARQQMDLDTYLKTRSISQEDFIANEVKPSAEGRVKRQLVLEEFASKENITFQPQELEMVYNMAMNQAKNDSSLKSLRKGKMNTREIADTLARSTINEIFNQRLLTRLRAIAEGKADLPEAEAEETSEAVEPVEAVEAESVEAVEAEAAVDAQPASEQEEEPTSDSE